mmetsp:Transcript_2013/g.2985  ORF Transcript_2013/g.2985 Transcript_2013/m.2985 type:complete len:101 (-) Transcript_2013:33-335(-)|eukprot:CAMPEP_0196139504 /NCGR_PEP_ID=MMETSP0910-20130528/6758_1 /TAXON_ID=49265 /ORGANISM="Thalassiosira rotula, Strain GSO102" /LENGTH=100 /DNA_ID=CAMNT_0041400237 /DNA_START=144 /DNA_END=446 /DNA_ORIENTATION=-
MRSRLLNQIPKTLRSSGNSSGSRGRRSAPQMMNPLRPTISQQRHALQQRLFSTHNIRMSRIVVGVEGCTMAMALVEGMSGAEANLPRGWDIGVAEEDDGG